MATDHAEQKKSRVNWSDPSVPVGNAPPMPRWPVAVTGLAWLAWLIFLMGMLMSRASAAAT